MPSAGQPYLPSERTMRGRPRARRMLTEMDPTQARLYELFGLDEYAPTR